MTECLLRWNLILHGNKRSRYVLKRYPLKWHEQKIKFTQHSRPQLMREKFSIPNVPCATMKILIKIFTVTHVKILIKIFTVTHVKLLIKIFTVTHVKILSSR